MRRSKNYWKYKQDVQQSERVMIISPRLRGTCHLTAICMLVYAGVMADIPVAMVAGAVLTGTFPSLGKFLGQAGERFLRQLMQAFSLTLFVGAIILVLFY